MSVRIMTADQRLGTTWRKKAYAALIERDGAACAECCATERTIWRTQGITVSHDWECPPGEPWRWPRHTIVNPSSNLEVDHKKPLWDGGTNEPENLWLLCIACHKKKTGRECSTRLKRQFSEARV